MSKRKLRFADYGKSSKYKFRKAYLKFLKNKSSNENHRFHNDFESESSRDSSSDDLENVRGGCEEDLSEEISNDEYPVYDFEIAHYAIVNADFLATNNKGKFLVKYA